MSDFMSELPVGKILEVLQGSDDPDLLVLSPGDWYQIENCLNKSVELRTMPRFNPAVIVPSDVEFDLKWRYKKRDAEGKFILDENGKHIVETVVKTFFVRELEGGDMLDIAGIGFQMLESFFGGSVEKMQRYSMTEMVQEVIARAMSQRLKNAMTDLSYFVIDKLANLMADKQTEELLTGFLLLQSDPVGMMDAIKKTLNYHTVFFSYLTSAMPGNFREGLHFLTGMISPNGNVNEMLKNMMASQR